MTRDLAQLFRIRSAYGGRFDAGGRTLLFVADIAGVPQVWALRPGAWPELVVAPNDRAQSIHPGPRPGQLIVAADSVGNEQTQLLLARDGAVTALVDDPAHVHRFGSWSTDGRLLSYAANTRDPRWFDVYVRDTESGATRLVLQDDSTNQAGNFSPDGTMLLVSRIFSSSEQELWLVDLAGSAPPRLLTPTRARYAQARFLSAGTAIVLRTDVDRDTAVPAILPLDGGTPSALLEPDSEVDSLTLAWDGSLLAYALNRDGEDELRIRDLRDGSDRRVEGLPRGALYSYWQRGIAFDRAGRRLAISWTAERENPDVWVHEVASGRTRRATHAPRAGVSTGRLAASETVRYPTFDGRQIPALWYRAPRGERPPCVIFVHGGPEGQFRPNWQPVVQHLVAAGFAMLAPNVRGSSGYGNAYEHLDDVRKRMDSVNDLAHAARWLASSGLADPARIAVWGGSYGGFMVLAALTTYPELWAAGVCLVGISNLVTFLTHTSPYRRHLREVEYGSLERDREFLESISPLNHVERITAPLFVVHGANDPRVPVGEAEQMVARLRELGRTVEYLRFDDEGHQMAKLKNRLVAYPAAAAFLRHHLLRRRR